MIDELIERIKRGARFRDKFICESYSGDEQDVAKRTVMWHQHTDGIVFQLLRGLPRPVTHDRKLGIDTRKQDWQYWLNKIREETREADIARDKWERARELMDIITVCVSCLASMGFDWLGRAKLGEETNEKNDERGCFK